MGHLFLENSLDHSSPKLFLKLFPKIPCTFRFLSLPLPSLQYLCGALRMNKGRDDMFKPNQLFLNVVGLFFCP